MKFNLLLGFLLYVLVITPGFSQYITLNTDGPSTPYSPSNRPRMAAEWEPALGTLIAWPLSIPKNLVIELAHDNKLYIVVASRAAQKEAVAVFTKWGIMPNQVRFIPAPQGIDVSWTRDWGPHAVFTPDGTMKLADGKYLYATPVTGYACDDTLTFLYHDEQHQVELTTIDDRIPDYISQATGYDVIHLPFAFTGGNVITDGQRSGFSTCALTNENRFSNVPDENFFQDVHQILGLENYNVISNFEERGIQHIDCFMKLLDEERMFVMQPPADHPLFEQYEGIVENELRYMKNAYGRPYQILRLHTNRYDGDDLAAYSNSLILNKVIYVPLFGIPQDSIAMQQWRSAMPGYSVKGFEFIMANEKILAEDCRQHYSGIGWNGGDALHCRTRAIWDPEMIYLSVDRLPMIIESREAYEVKTIIKDYSGKGLIMESLKLLWRASEMNEWKEVRLTKGQLLDQYVGTIPSGRLSGSLQYYISAESQSGKKETMPRVAPGAYYEAKISINSK